MCFWWLHFVMFVVVYNMEKVRYISILIKVSRSQNFPQNFLEIFPQNGSNPAGSLGGAQRAPMISLPQELEKARAAGYFSCIYIFCKLEFLKRKKIISSSTVKTIDKNYFRKKFRPLFGHLWTIFVITAKCCIFLKYGQGSRKLS